MDRLQSHTNKFVQNNLGSHHVRCFHFPPQGGKLGSVCDNSLFAVLKARLKKWIFQQQKKREKHFFNSAMNSHQILLKNFIIIVDENFKKIIKNRKRIF